jgi:hypothetical protein
LPNWDPIKPKDLLSWIASQWDPENEPPASYDLDIETSRSVPSAARSPLRSSSELSRRADSGTLEARFPRVPPALLESPRSGPLIFSEILAIASEEDPGRDFLGSTGYESTRIVANFESVLREEDLPVIGPGGRLTVYDVSNLENNLTLEADIVVRRRINRVESGWLPQTEIVARIARQMAERFLPDDTLTLLAQFGYFELSKHELQTLLRPVVFLSFEVTAAEEPGLSWIDTIVEPVTAVPDRLLDEGLGSWAE